MKFTLGGTEYDVSREQVEERLAQLQPEALKQVFVVVKDRRFPVKQALSVGAGIVRSGFTTQDAIRILRKMGFTVGELPVTFELRTNVLPGFPDFWDRVVEKYFGPFEAMPDIVRMGNEVFAVPVTEPVQKLCRMLSKNILTSLSALHILCVNGFGVDAMKVARSMFEGAVTVTYLGKHPEEAEDFLDYNWISKKKLLDYMEQHDTESAAQIPPENKKETLQHYAAVVSRFRNKNGEVRARWSKKSFAQLAADVGAFSIYRTFYYIASSMHHMDIVGVTSQVEQNEDGRNFDADVAPSMQWIDQALMPGHAAVVLSMSSYIEIAKIDRPDVVKKLEEGLEVAWPAAAAAYKAKSTISV